MWSWICCNFTLRHSWLSILETRQRCLYVCLSVYLFDGLCGCQLYSQNGWADFDENAHKYTLGCLLMQCFSLFLILTWCCHGSDFVHILTSILWHFCLFNIAWFSSMYDTIFWFWVKNGCQNQNLLISTDIKSRKNMMSN